MARLIFGNNDATTIAGSIGPTDTQVNLVAGTGALFPQPIVGLTEFIATLIDQLTGQLREIVHVTAIVGDTAILVRAQENTLAQSWPAGSIFAHLHTAGAMQAMMQIGDISSSIATSMIYVGYDSSLTANIIQIPTTSPQITALLPDMVFEITIANAATGPTTMQIQGFPSYPLIDSTLDPIADNELFINQKILVSFTGTAFQLLNYNQQSQSGNVPTFLPYGGIFYCDANNGNDITGDGSNGNPWQDLPHAVTTIVRGYISPGYVTIECAPGTYRGIDIPESLIAYWNIFGSGAFDCFINETTPPTPSPWPPAYGRGRGLVTNNNYVSIDGFRISSYLEGVSTNSGGGFLNIYDVDFDYPVSGAAACVNPHHGEVYFRGGTCNFYGGGNNYGAIQADQSAVISIGADTRTPPSPTILNFVPSTVLTRAGLQAFQNGSIEIQVATTQITGNFIGTKFTTNTGGGIFQSDDSGVSGLNAKIPGTVNGAPDPSTYGWVV
jgi:hypothetical protein